MRLVPKISLALAGAAAASIVAAALWFDAGLSPRLQALDRETALRNGTRIGATIDDVLSRLASLNRDWAHWDATYAFMSDRNAAYVEGNLKFSDLENIDVDAAVFVDSDHRVVFQRAYNHKTGVPETWFKPGETFTLADWPDFAPGHARDDHTGLIQIEGRPALMSVTPILTSAMEGPARGALVFVRFLTPERIDEIEDSTQLVLRFTPVGQDAAAAAPGGPDNAARLAAEPGENFTRILVQLPDPSGRPSYVAEASLPRPFFGIGQSILRTVILGLAGTALIIFFLGIFVMSRLVARPLQRLTAHMDKVTATGIPEPTALRLRNDEIGAVGRQFDALIASLTKSRQLLEEQSYFGGMADISASVIHNVRNALNPINTEVWRAEKALEDVRVERLAEAAREIGDAGCAPERRAKLAELIAAAAGLAGDGKQAAMEAHERILNFSGHIDEILAHYDDVSRSARGNEPVEIGAILRSAAEFARASRNPPVTVRLDNALPAAACVMAQRIVLTQIMSNLISNAVDSMRRAGLTAGVIELGAVEARTDGVAFVDIRVGDNGQGIADGEADRIFQRDYSKRRERAGGLGLFWCAKSAAALGGTIFAEPAATGARITLRLPLVEATPGSTPS